MNTTLTACIITATLFASVYLGIRLRRLLPAHHLSADGKDAVKLALGLVATMSALLLGLLVSSAKGTYDTQRDQIIQIAAKVMFLDRVLARYGPETMAARVALHRTVEEGVARVWPKGHRARLVPNLRGGDEVFNAIQALSPRDDTQRSLKAQASALGVDVGQLQSLLLARSVASISTPLLVVVVCWLVVIFIGFSLVAPPNPTASVALLVSAFSVSGAIFLILELDRPFGGLIQVTSEPILVILNQLGK